MSIRRWALLGALVAPAWGCGGESVDPPPVDATCTEQGLPEEIRVPSDAAAPFQGSISISDRLDRTVDDNGTPRNISRGLIQAAFADVSTSTDTPENLMPIGFNCIGRLSRSTVNSPTFLEMESLKVTNTGRGEVVTTSNGTGLFVQSGGPILAGASGARAIGTGVTGGLFPSFDEAVEPIEALEITEPLSDGNALLKVNDLPIRWTGAGGQGLLITLIPIYTTPMQSGGQVLCQVVDDGCFNLPAAATNFALANTDQGQAVAKFTLVVERYRIRVIEPSEQRLLTIESKAEYRLTLRNGVE